MGARHHLPLLAALVTYSQGAIALLFIFLAFLIGMAIGRHRPRVMARRVSRERVPAGPMPWCQRCRCYHHHTAPHIDLPAFLRRQAE